MDAVLPSASASAFFLFKTPLHTNSTITPTYNQPPSQRNLFFVLYLRKTFKDKSTFKNVKNALIASTQKVLIATASRPSTIIPTTTSNKATVTGCHHGERCSSSTSKSFSRTIQVPRET